MKIKCEKMGKCNISYNILFGEILCLLALGAKARMKRLSYDRVDMHLRRFTFFYYNTEYIKFFGADNNTLTHLRLQLTVNI